MTQPAKIRRALLPALLLCLAPACDEDDQLLTFVIVTPEGQDTFSGVTSIRVTFNDQESTSSITGSGASFSVDLELDVGETGQVLLEGLDGDGDVICRGRSPDVLAVASTAELVLWVGRVGAFGRGQADGGMPHALAGPAMADYLQEDWDDSPEDNLLATFWFGGRAPDGTLNATPYYYDAYFHETYDLDPMPTPREDMSAMNIDSGYFLLFGGRDQDGDPSGQMDLMMPSNYVYAFQENLDYGVTGAERAGAPVVMLGPYPSLFEAASVRIMNSFLVTGGTGPTGPRCDYLHVRALYDSGTALWSAAAERRDLAACRAGHTATLTEVSEDGDTIQVALIWGGAGPGEPVAEVVRLHATQPDIDTVEWNWEEAALDPDPGPMVHDHTATTLPDGRILIVGGETADGSRVASGWIFEPVDHTVTEVGDLLATPRSNHTATLVGDELVVAGGSGPDGASLADAEIIDVGGDNPVRVGVVPLTGARAGHQAFRLASGNVGLLGGVNSVGEIVTYIDIYTPGLVD